jgi:hypothetical protein
LKTIDNPCIRCGKDRIIAKEWKEKVGNSVIICTTNVCPDAECQKVVDAQLKSKKDRFDAIQKNSQMKRAENRRNSQTAKKN